MTKSASKKAKTPRATCKVEQITVQVINNAHTPQELAESGERWATHTGPYLTLDEIINIESTKKVD